MVTLPETRSISNDFPPVEVAAWRALVERELAGVPFERRLVTHTYEGVSIRPLYTQDDAPPSVDGCSGFMPFTRGGRLLGTAIDGWDVRQEHAAAVPAAMNLRILEDLAGGVNSVLIRFDAAARQGLDADDPAAAHLAARDGSAIYAIADLREALEGVHLEMITVAIEAGAAFLPASALLASLWRERGIDPAKARGAFNADPFAVLARDGRLPMSLDNALEQMADLAVSTARKYPRSTSVRIGSAPYHHGGATASQDLGFSIATGIAYLRSLTAAGMTVSDAARQMVFSFAVGTNFFLAAAKLRAARTLWSRVVEACGGPPEACRMTMHVRTSKRSMTTRDPWTNLLRNTAGMFAAGIAGADVVSSAPYDQALGEPGARGRRIARNTAAILQEEAHLLRVADPAGGSWFIERLTADIADKAWAIVQDIESRGGMRAALTSGWIEQQIASTHDARSRNIATRRDAVLGVSEFPDPAEKERPEPTTDPDTVARDRAARLSEMRKSRAGFTPPSGLAFGDGSATQPLTASAAADATIGEMARAVSTGVPETIPAPVAVHPYAEGFEALRDAVDQHVEAMGVRPRVCLVALGTPSETSAREGFAANFFAAGGFAVSPSGPCDTVSVAAGRFAESGAGVAVMCSTDARYAADAVDLAAALHAAGARSVVLAGHPGEHESAFRAAGIDRFIFLKCDVLATLREMLAEEGVLV